MKILFIIILFVLISGCTTIEVAKEVSKATSSIKNSVENMINSIEKDKEILELEKENEKKLIIEQKKIVKINFLNKNIDEIKKILDKPNLSRLDGNNRILRFDTKKCRLFLIFDISDLSNKIKYYEIRDTNGDLIIKKNKVQDCYKDLNLS